MHTVRARNWIRRNGPSIVNCFTAEAVSAFESEREKGESQSGACRNEEDILDSGEL